MDDDNALEKHLGDSTPDDDSDGALARREAAEALRALCHDLYASPATPDQLRLLAESLREHHTQLVAGDSVPGAAAGEGDLVPGMRDFHDRSPIAGLANPLAAPARLSVDRDAGIVRGEVCFGPAFEGAPGIVHGGFVAAVLDEALGMASVFSGTPCMTAELTARYRHHTPVGRPLRIEARCDIAEGRKVSTSGEIYDGDTALVECTGLFIAVDVEKFAKLLAARNDKDSR